MSEETLGNQSEFVVDQETATAPPEIDMAPEAVMKRQQEKRQKTIIGIVGLLGVVVLIILMMGLNKYISRPAPYIPPPTPTPLPPLNSTKMQDELSRLQFFVDQANPKVEYIAPPTLDMTIKF